MTALTPRHRTTNWDRLCTQFCRAYSFTSADLKAADKRSRHCYRRTGPGKPSAAQRYPGMIMQALLPLLLLASQRRTSLAIDEVARRLGLDEWDALESAARAETRLATDPSFALALESFLDGLDGVRRNTPETFERGMTHQEIADELGLSRQRVVQIEQKALRKLKRNGMLKELMKGLLG